jgi:small subunit ribosomal protein S18
MSDGESKTVEAAATAESTPAASATPAPAEQAPRSDSDSRPPRPDRDSRDSRDSRDGRDGREERPRGNWSVKARLRAAARKKARKSKKKGMFQRRKVCRFCADKNVVIDYKEPKTLRLFISETGKMTPRRISGTCAKHQRKLAVEIKRARHIASLPYAASHV